MSYYNKFTSGSSPELKKKVSIIDRAIENYNYVIITELNGNISFNIQSPEINRSYKVYLRGNASYLGGDAYHIHSDSGKVGVNPQQR